ncbi:MAG: ArsR family transcriptional regulator [Candidatus Bathyarchaeota archaeon]|nr:MAG: ArsR family transcriptional regulator [Candidatus Bathyarchaeota archaeon]
MQIRIVRRISMAEVQRRIAWLEGKYDGTIDDISDRFTDGRLGREAFEDYIEWMGMEHALRAYGEGEDFDYFTEDIVDLEKEELSKLTPRRLELMDQISRHRVESINELASRVGRDVKNVYNDLKILENLGFVGLVKEGRRLVPDLLVKEITFLTW